MPKLAVTEGSGRRVPILARVTPAVRESLEAAAGASGRSLSQEIEHRLMLSVLFDNLGPMIAAAVAEGIAADRERQRRAVLARATPSVSGP